MPQCGSPWLPRNENHTENHSPPPGQIHAPPPYPKPAPDSRSSCFPATPRKRTRRRNEYKGKRPSAHPDMLPPKKSHTEEHARRTFPVSRQAAHVRREAAPAQRKGQGPPPGRLRVWQAIPTGYRIAERFPATPVPARKRPPAPQTPLDRNRGKRNPYPHIEAGQPCLWPATPGTDPAGIALK